MTTSRTLRYSKFIISFLFSFFIVFFSPDVSYAKTHDEEKCMEVCSFDELVSSLNQLQSTGGTIVLTQDITVPVEESFAYSNARYRKEVVIETQGHTIYVEGTLDFMPFLTILGDGTQSELFHVYPGGELRLTSVCLDAGQNGVAIVQEEASLLIYGSEETLGLPEFSCTGEIISSKTMTAAAYWRYNFEELPIVRIPYGADFTPDMLPKKVLSIVNKNHLEYEEEVPVFWDETTFPQKNERVLVQGKFAEGYTQYQEYMPLCLVVWESNTSPFFLNVYQKNFSQQSNIVYMYGQAPLPGTIYIQTSKDGKSWESIEGTEGYAPIEVEEDSTFSWMLFYEQSESFDKCSRYYRMLQILEDGTKLYSETLQLSDDHIFALSQIDGGRGGETSPNEGNQQPNGIEQTDDKNTPSNPTDSQPKPESNYEEDSKEIIEGSDHYSDDQNTESSTSNDSRALTGPSKQDSAQESVPSENNEDTAKEKDANLAKEQDTQLEYERNLSNARIQKIAGIAIVGCVLAGSVIVSVRRRKA